MKTLKRLMSLVGIALAVTAVRQELKRPSEERTWQGTVCGVVPYDLRFPPTIARIRERWWNPDDSRLFTPHVFGVGWSVNLYRLTRRCRSDEDEAQKAA
jgi:Family of unknown function (DUF5808)